MAFRKRYGQSREDTCPFCNKNASTQNAQGVPVCQAHSKAKLGNLKCVCGEYIDLRAGKWGPYGNCINCGNLNFHKVLELNPQDNLPSQPTTSPPKPVYKKNTPLKVKVKHKPKEITITSDEVDFM